MLWLKGRVLLPLLCFLIPPFLTAQAGIAGAGDFAVDKIDPVSLVGLTLDELVSRFGVPRSVYAVRGIEEWQDDVVFVYEQADFYVYKDRVWQAGLKEARGIKIGDPQAVVSLVLGTGGETKDNSVFCSLNEGAWPMMLRFDFDSAGKVRAIFIYRTDM